MSEVLEISSFRSKCPHKHIEYCESTNEIKCRDCSKELNPIFVIKKLIKERYNSNKKIAEANVLWKNLKRRKKVKCKHCGKFTDVKVNASLNEIREEL